MRSCAKSIVGARRLLRHCGSGCRKLPRNLKLLSPKAKTSGYAQSSSRPLLKRDRPCKTGSPGGQRMLPAPHMKIERSTSDRRFFITRTRANNLENVSPDFFIPFFCDTDFDSMRFWSMLATVSDLTADHGVTRNISMHERLWCWCTNTTTRPVPRQILNVAESIFRKAPIVPLPTHFDENIEIINRIFHHTTHSLSVVRLITDAGARCCSPENFQKRPWVTRI